MTNEEMEIRRILAHGNVEIRCIDKRSELAIKQGRPVIWSGVFDDYDELVKAIKFSEICEHDIYHTINPVSVSAGNGKLRPFIRTARDNQISSLSTIFFDFDAVREKGVAATDTQVSSCMDQANLLIDYLESHGWCVPIVGYSGNGVHVRYNVNLPVQKLDGLYAGLKLRFNTDVVSFDVTVKNPSRIARCLGTTNRKSAVRSKCVLFSGEILDSDVFTDTLEKLTPPKRKRTWVKPAAEQKGRHIKSLDAVALFTRHGLYLDNASDPDKHFVTCPWEAGHTVTTPTDSVIWQQDFPVFFCSHDHCEGKTMRDVIALFGVEE